MRIPRLNLAATPLRFLGYLLADPIVTAVLDGGATLVRVPVRFVRQGAQRLAEGSTRDLVLRLTERP